MRIHADLHHPLAFIVIPDSQHFLLYVHSAAAEHTYRRCHELFSQTSVWLLNQQLIQVPSHTRLEDEVNLQVVFEGREHTDNALHPAGKARSQRQALMQRTEQCGVTCLSMVHYACLYHILVCLLCAHSLACLLASRVAGLPCREHIAGQGRAQWVGPIQAPPGTLLAA